MVLAAIAGRGSNPDPSQVAASIKTGEQIAPRHEAARPSSVFPQIAFALEQLGSINGATELIAAVTAAAAETE